MSPTPANDNVQRPASFDAAVLQWMPLLRKIAYRLERNAQDREDLVNETVAVALHRWSSYREGGSFSGWLAFQMRERCTELRRRARRMPPAELPEDFLSCSPPQDDQLELRQVVSHLKGRPGVILIRRAMGEELQQIGDDMGISRQRAHQLETIERARLVRGLNTVRVMA